MSGAQRVVVFSATAGYRHESIPAAVAARAAMPRLDVVASEDAAVLHDLAGVGAVVFASTSGDVLDRAARASLRGYVQAGGGFAGIHSAAAIEQSWPWYAQLLGARFAGHPPGVQAGTAVVADAAHPSTEAVPPRWTVVDEWYAFTDVRADLDVLLAVDESTYAPGEFTMEWPHPQAWHRRVGRGWSWFTAWVTAPRSGPIRCSYATSSAVSDRCCPAEAASLKRRRERLQRYRKPSRKRRKTPPWGGSGAAGGGGVVLLRAIGWS